MFVVFVQRGKSCLRRRLFLFSLTIKNNGKCPPIFALYSPISFLLKVNLINPLPLAVAVLDCHQNYYSVIKLLSEQFATRIPKKEKAAAAIVATTTMKRFVVFIILLSLFIAGEYYFLTELITQKRAWVISASLLVSVISLYYLIRFFKHSLISSRPTGS